LATPSSPGMQTLNSKDRKHKNLHTDNVKRLYIPKTETWLDSQKPSSGVWLPSSRTRPEDCTSAGRGSPRWRGGSTAAGASPAGQKRTCSPSSLELFGVRQDVSGWDRRGRHEGGEAQNPQKRLGTVRDTRPAEGIKIID
jgi:hypothetical protein